MARSVATALLAAVSGAYWPHLDRLLFVANSSAALEDRWQMATSG